jgi:hypothetical protein
LTSKRSGLSRARRDCIEPCAVLRFGQSEPVKVDGRGLRQPVFDDGIEAIAAPRDDDRIFDPLSVHIGHVAAAAEQRIDALDDQTPDRAQRCDRTSGQTGIRRNGTAVGGKPAGGSAGGSSARRQKSSAIQSGLRRRGNPEIMSAARLLSSLILRPFWSTR